MPIPLLASLLLGGASGLGSLFGAKSQANAQKQMTQMQIDANKAAQQADIASKESTLDPFRQAMMQARDLSWLDQQQNLKPTQPYGLTGDYAKFNSAPREPAYTPSSELLNWLAMLKQNVAGGGNQAPTMTSPGNYGKTSALDLLALASGQGNAGSARGVNMAPPAPMYSTGRMRPNERV